jgi:hypothetical protein
MQRSAPYSTSSTTGRCAAGAQACARSSSSWHKSALRSLPPLPYEYAEWKRCRIGLDYHVEIAKHYYSVPHQLLRPEVGAGITVATVEIFHRGKRVASRRRSLCPHRPTTVPKHLPSGLRRYRDWTLERIRPWRRNGRPDAAVLVDVILRSRPHPEQGFHSCVGILRFGQALWRRTSWRHLRPRAGARHSVLHLGRRDPENRERVPAAVAEPPLLIHENIRGPARLLPLTGDAMLIHPP